MTTKHSLPCVAHGAKQGLSSLVSRPNEKLVDAQGLLDALFEESCRPSLRWIRQMQSQRKIPYVKIGHLVRFDVEKVRKALDEHCTINPREW